MNSSNLLSVVTFIYGLAACLYLFSWIFKKPFSGKLGLYVTFTGAVSHTVGIAMRWMESYRLNMGHAPLSNLYESLIFFAWTIAVIYLIIIRKYKEEAFGAVAALIRGESLDQAIEWINTKTYLGHSAAIMTSSGKHARKYIREVNVGNIAVNLGVAQPYAFFPLGSRRESFVGTAKSRLASMKMFMDEKTVVTRWA